jgi:hypothetical protein
LEWAKADIVGEDVRLGGLDTLRKFPFARAMLASFSA